jgi:N6-adenosine-specific RNA methylase IME4
MEGLHKMSAEKPYRSILIDPPWNESGGGKCKRGADRHYPLMKTRDIVALVEPLLYGLTRPIPGLTRPMPVGPTAETPAGTSIPLYHCEAGYPVADNAHLWLWVTNNYLPDGLKVMQALGFRYVTNVCWAKMEHADTWFARKFPALWKASGWLKDTLLGLFVKMAPGLGQYIAGQHELLLFGVRGKLPALWKDKTSGAKRQGTLICAPRGKHSQKPVEAYELIENVSPGPRLELFARGRARAGWDTWGNETE